MFLFCVCVFCCIRYAQQNSYSIVYAHNNDILCARHNSFAVWNEHFHFSFSISLCSTQLLDTRIHWKSEVVQRSQQHNNVNNVNNNEIRCIKLRRDVLGCFLFAKRCALCIFLSLSFTLFPHPFISSSLSLLLETQLLRLLKLAQLWYAKIKIFNQMMQLKRAVCCNGMKKRSTHATANTQNPDYYFWQVEKRMP